MRRRRVLALTAATIAAAGFLAAGALPASAAPPSAESFDVAFGDASCTNVAASVVSRLHVRFMDKEQPDGTVHHWIDIVGTITNEETGEYVRLRATRRFFDNAPDDQARFAGLQSTFSAPRHGVLQLNAGWARGALSESVATYATRGRWDGIAEGLPPSVCAVLAGGSPADG